MQLSKSDYLLFLKHPAWLWLKKHDKNKLPPIDLSTQATFDAGHKFEAYAEALFENGVTLGFNDFDEYGSLTERTTQALIDGHTTIYQSRFVWGEYNCLPDIINIIGDKEIDLYEIKSSTRVKEEHLYDLAFQRAVIEANGLNIRKIFVIYVNNAYVRHGQINPTELTKIDDVTLAVHNLASFTETKMPLALEVMKNDKMPDPDPNFLSKLGDKREWQTIYESLVPVQKVDYSNIEPTVSALLVQKEVAERIAAGPGEMSMLALAAQVYAVPSLGIEVPREYFTPPPEVDSQVIVLRTRSEPLVAPETQAAFFRLARAGFSEKRKKLRSSLAGGLHLGRNPSSTPHSTEPAYPPKPVRKNCRLKIGKSCSVSSLKISCSLVNDGTMKKADADPVAVDNNRRRFLEREGASLERSVLVQLDYNSDDFCRYDVIDGSATGEGMMRDGRIADGLATTEKNVVLFLPLADCIGVVLYDPEHQAVMLTHLGRHNLEQQGGQKSVEFMAMQFGSDPGQLEVYFSPSAGKENYPVFSFDGQSLADVALAQLTTAGVKRTNVTLSPIDTTTDQDYFSHSQYHKGYRKNDGRFGIATWLM